MTNDTGRGWRVCIVSQTTDLRGHYFELWLFELVILQRLDRIPGPEEEEDQGTHDGQAQDHQCPEEPRNYPFGDSLQCVECASVHCHHEGPNHREVHRHCLHVWRPHGSDLFYLLASYCFHFLSSLLLSSCQSCARVPNSNKWKVFAP